MAILSVPKVTTPKSNTYAKFTFIFEWNIQLIVGQHKNILYIECICLYGHVEVEALQMDS